MLDSFVAVKILDLNQADAEQALKRFQNEAELLNSFNHNNIVKFLSYGKSPDGLPFMVLEHLEGRTLADVLEKGTLSPVRAQEIFEQVCEGLKYAHERGVIHRDIKPSNLMIINENEEDEIVKILDFGAFKRDEVSVQQQLTQQGALIGTPNYMSPEQCRGEKADARSDIYSLGCVMYESLCGAPPMMAESDYAIMNNHLNTMVTKVKSKSAISHKFENVLIKCMSKNPAERFSSAAELSQTLAAIKPEGSFRVPKKALAISAAVVLVSFGLYALKQNIQKKDREINRSVVAAVEKKRYQGTIHNSLRLISPPKTVDDHKKNLEVLYDWLNDNHDFLMRHYTRDVPTADQGPTEIIDTYSMIVNHRRFLNQPDFGKDLARKIEEENLEQISRLKNTRFGENTLLNKERRTIFHHYRILIGIALADDDVDKAEKYLKEAEAIPASAAIKNDFLINSYQRMVMAYSAKNFNDIALKWSDKLIDFLNRMDDHDLRRLLADIEIANLYKKLNRDEDARKLYLEAANIMIEHRDDPGLKAYTHDLSILSGLAFALNLYGLQKLSIELLSPAKLWVNGSRRPGWLKARAFLAQSYLYDGKVSEAMKIYKQITPLAKSDLPDVDIVRLLIAGDQICYAVVHEPDDAKLQKVVDQYWPLIPDSNIVDFYNLAQLRLGNKVADEPRQKRLFHALEKFDSKRHAIGIGGLFATRAHYLRGQHRNADAIELYLAAVKKFKSVQPYYHGGIVCYYATVLCLLDAGQLDKIDPILKEAYAQDALRKEPNFEHYMLEHGKFDYLRRKGDFKAAGELGHKDVTELLRLVDLDRKQGKPERWQVQALFGACTDYLSAHDPDPEATALAKEVDQLLNDTDRAIALVGPPSSDEIEFITAMSTFYTQAAVVKRKAGHREEAILLFKRALNMLPPRSEMEWMRKNLRKELGLD